MKEFDSNSQEHLKVLQNIRDNLILENNSCGYIGYGEALEQLLLILGLAKMDYKNRIKGGIV